MATKKSFIVDDLDWAEQQLSSWKSYIDDNPIHEMKDRIEWKPTAKGGLLPMVIASIETQVKSMRETMKDYLILLDQVDRLREKEEAKQEAVKGDGKIPNRMRTS